MSDTVTEEEKERVRWATAEQQVEAFIGVFTKRYGIKEEEIPDLVASLRWAAEYRTTIKKTSFAVALTVLGTVVGGMVIAFWEGVKVILRQKTGGE